MRQVRRAIVGGASSDESIIMRSTSKDKGKGSPGRGSRRAGRGFKRRSGLAQEWAALPPLIQRIQCDRPSFHLKAALSEIPSARGPVRYVENTGVTVEPD